MFIFLTFKVKKLIFEEWRRKKQLKQLTVESISKISGMKFNDIQSFNFLTS
jgi:hypothetical protein